MVMTITKFLKTYGSKTVSFILAFLMFFSAFPFSVFVGAADNTPAPAEEDTSQHVIYYFDGAGTVYSPYVLRNELDFKGLAENILYFASDPAVNGYKGKYFRVETAGIGTSGVINFSGSFSIGVDGDATKCFYGNLDLNGYVLYLNAPLFGSIGSGASVSNGTLVLNDINGTSLKSGGNWGALACSAIASADAALDNYITISEVIVAANIDASGKTATGVGGAIGRIINHTSNNLTVAFHESEMHSYLNTTNNTGASFDLHVNAESLGGAVGCIDNGVDYGTTVAEVDLVLRRTKVNGSLQNDSENGYVGGLVGRANLGSSIQIISTTDVPGTGSLNAQNADHIGAIVGLANRALVFADTNSVKVEGTEKTYASLGTVLCNNGDLFIGLDLGELIPGAGTEQTPYVISTPNQMLILAAVLNSHYAPAFNNFSYFGANRRQEVTNASDILYYLMNQAYYRIEKDIDVSHNGFGGLGYYDGTNTSYFRGHFGGAVGTYPTIKLAISGNDNYRGLFAALANGADIHNLTLSGTVTTSGSYVGALAGAVIGLANVSDNITVKDIKLNGLTVTNTNATMAVTGGLVGVVNYANANCYTQLIFRNVDNNANVTAQGYFLGGMVGAVYTPSQEKQYDKLNYYGYNANGYGVDVTVEGYTFGGKVYSDSNHGKYMGGCIGAVVAIGGYKDHASEYKISASVVMQFDPLHLIVSNCDLHGEMVGSYYSTGMFAGALDGVSAVFNQINITGSGTVTHNISGLAQTISGYAVVDNVYVTFTDWTVFASGAAHDEYGGILFGNTIDAWLEVGNVDVAYYPDIVPQDHFALISSYTYDTTDVFLGSTVEYSGFVNLEDVYDVSGLEKSDKSRYYQNSSLVTVDFETIYAVNETGMPGSAENPFVIDTADKLLKLSLLQNLSSKTVWRVLKYFDLGSSYEMTAINKWMYLKTAHYVIKGNLDFGSTNRSFYAMNVIGGSYVGDGAVITLKDDTGLFGIIDTGNKDVTVDISGLTIKGSGLGKVYNNGVLIAKIHESNVNISNIIFDGFETKKQDASTSPYALIAGVIDGGVVSIDGVLVKKNGNSGTIASALIGTVTPTYALVNIHRVRFDNMNVIDGARFVYDNSNPNVSYYDEKDTDGSRYSYQYTKIDASGGDYLVSLNPKSSTLSVGYGTVEAPYAISDASQLAALAKVLAAKGNASSLRKLFGSDKVLTAAQGLFTADMITEETTPEQLDAIVDALASAYYRLSCNITFEYSNSYGFSGIGTAQSPFTGTLDGQGYTIVLTDYYPNAKSIPSGSTVDAASKIGVKDFGLFKYIKGATIRNLTITTDKDTGAEGIWVGGTNDEKDYTASCNGLVAAYALGGDNLIDNVAVKGKMVATTNDSYIGGYVGKIVARYSSSTCRTITCVILSFAR